MNAELQHYGVKGMKWGVRKKYYKSHMDSDRTLKKGFKVQNISADGERDLSRNTPTYTSHTAHDNNAYAGRYASAMAFRGQKAYKNDLVLVRDVKIPSQKKAVELFMELYDKDPEGMARSIGKAYAELDYFHAVSKIRDWNADRKARKFAKKGREWVESKGYLMFNQTMMATEESAARTKYYDLLMKKGYGAISDINDVQTGYGADDPIIFINPKQTLKNAKSRALTPDEIELADARYQYDEAVRNRNIYDDIVVGTYRAAKKNLKRVEKRQGINRKNGGNPYE